MGVKCFGACRRVETMSLFWRKSLPLVRHRPFSTLRAIFWHLTRRKMRAANIIRDASRGLPLAYRQWLLAQEEEAIALAARTASEASRRPTLTVVIHYLPSCSHDLRSQSHRSVEQQRSGPDKVIDCTVDRLAEALAQATGDYLFLLRAGDRLASSALFRISHFLQAGRPPIAFGDEDSISRQGKEPVPWFKGEWNREMFLALDYLSSAVAIRMDLVRAVLAHENDSVTTVDELLIRATILAGDQIAHLPAILVHKRSLGEPQGGDRLGVVATVLGPEVTCRPGPFATIHVQWPLPKKAPLVSIIVPTRDKVHLLRTCVGSVDAHNAYDPIEWVVVDNGSEEQATLDYLTALSARTDAKVIRSDAPFNFSRLNNLGVREATGEYVLLLNNDTEAVSDQWLTEMMRYAARVDVGAVGAKLLYADGSLQHAGVVVGMGEAAGHAHRYLPANDPGYFRQPHVAQEVTAVTAACLLVRKDRYMAVGGLDEERFAVAYNDVDLCLKLRAAGWRNIYTPHAMLFHHESKSRGSDFSPANEARYRRELKNLQDRWDTRNFADPLHSPHLDRYSETFRTRF